MGLWKIAYDAGLKFYGNHATEPAIDLPISIPDAYLLLDFLQESCVSYSAKRHIKYIDSYTVDVSWEPNRCGSDTGALSVKISLTMTGEVYGNIVMNNIVDDYGKLSYGFRLVKEKLVKISTQAYDCLVAQNAAGELLGAN